MITKEELEKLKEKSVNDYDINDLVDITQIEIDTSKPVHERVCDFITKVKNPYIFKVGNVPVKVSFSENGPTLQESLLNLIKTNLE